MNATSARRRSSLGLTAILAMVALSACGDPGVVPRSGGSLDGRTFLSETITGRALVAGTEIRLSFEQGRLGATAGCNSMGAPYSVEESTLRIEGDGLATTEIGCDPARHAQDEWLSGFLTSTPTVDLEGDVLTLSAGSTAIRLLDREVADPDRALVGTTWVVDTVIDGQAAASVPSKTSVTLIFLNGDGFKTTAQGCTSADGAVEIGSGTLRFGEFTVDTIGCPTPWDETLKVLRAGEATYEIEADRLTIMAGDIGISAIARSS